MKRDLDGVYFRVMRDVEVDSSDGFSLKKMV